MIMIMMKEWINIRHVEIYDKVEKDSVRKDW
jgi:hypothetical protein